MNAWCVVSNAGAGRSGDPTAEVSEALADASVEFEIHSTSTPAAAADIVGDAAARGFGRFAAVGGDGTLHHLLNAVMATSLETRPLLGLIPAGSGSDFVRTFAHGGDRREAIARIADPDPYTVDVGVVEGTFGTRYFINALDAGIAAASVAMAERLPRWLGGLRYTIGFWASLGGFTQTGVTVGVDRHRFVGHAINVVVANGQFFGGGLNIAPRATLDDGTFDVQVFSGPRRNAFVIMPRLAFGTHLTHRAVRRYLGGSVEILTPDDWPIEADGELLGTGSVRIRCIGGAVDFAI